LIVRTSMRSSIATVSDQSVGNSIQMEGRHKFMNPPTHFELATLAATQPGTPPQQAQAAIAIWKACGQELERESIIRQAVDADDEWMDKMREHFPDGETVSLESFLKVAMPRSKPEDRLKKFRSWNRQLIAYHSKLEGEELEDVTAKAMERARLEGYDSRTASDLSANFLGFLERVRSESNTAKAKTAATAKNSALSVLKTQKSPQAQRKTRQAKAYNPQAGGTRPQADKTRPQAGKP
jgi:hypothetical protein